ncbi:aldehyde dehydrogenase family protein [Sphingobacterium prati]|uniref:aldehyde dehydrogenase family protein n=1 Tax=Sphingobacterium prati TaxID=2737006 RepID=UPI00155567DC|nr:aldehyde dehydrogenase family protein [Sphingobacterium prati]NPE45483.1 aldehyde dehydrogenase family protein [Sphingobacterium prati]
MSKIALNWINGEWVDSAIHKDSINPATGEKIGVYADGGQAEALKAITVAKEVYKNSDWKHNRHLRYKVLNELADAFEANTERLKEILMMENGKVAREAIFEISLVAPKLRYYAAQALTEFGRALETQPGRFSMLLAEPIGVAGIIAPWNSPIILMIRSLAPALAAGCTAVIKMPSQTAQTNYVINEVMASVKTLPIGVINQFTESGHAGASLMVESPDVPTISYTGSTSTGSILMQNGASKLKRFGFELGGKTPMLIFDDANLDEALPVLEKAITVFAGQFCMTGSRILVQSGIANSFITQFTKRLEKVKVGPASDPTSDMGPIIDHANVDRIDALVEKAIVDGAEILVRGGKITHGSLTSGAFYRPTLLKVKPEDNKIDIVQQEIFGPVATVQIFDTPEEAIALANDSQFGLAASVWSQNVDLPLKVIRELDAGTVWINNWAVVNDEFEEGGYKMSGLGRLNGLNAIHDFVEYKHIFHGAGTL